MGRGVVVRKGCHDLDGGGKRLRSSLRNLWLESLGDEAVCRICDGETVMV